MTAPSPLGETSPVIFFKSLPPLGISLERYCYKTPRVSTLNNIFKDNALVMILNMSGHGIISHHANEQALHTYHLPIAPQTVLVQIKKQGLLSLQRTAQEQQHFFVVKVSRCTLSSLFKKYPHAIKQNIQLLLNSSDSIQPPLLSPFCFNIRTLSEELSLPKHPSERPSLWFYAKILEIISHLLLEPHEGFCCQRSEHLALERIAAVKKILARDLEHPPSLTQCAHQVGCSAAYLSRTFSQYTGMTISRYLRTLRLERSAELLRSGKYNVTEAAITVGYSSLSHFSKAFAERFNICPCAFGLESQHQKKGHPISSV